MDLTEAEDIKKRWKEYTEKLYQKDLHNSNNHECEDLFCAVLLCILATSSYYLLLLLGQYCFWPLLCPSLHEMLCKDTLVPQFS